jgi:hypothetical protein
MALLPYSVRQVTQRSKGRRDRGDRGDRGELRLPSSTPTSASSPAPEELDDTIEFVDDEASGLIEPDEVVDGAGDLDASDLDASDLDAGDVA